jgi:NAD(P)H-hydrate epimerase
VRAGWPIELQSAESFATAPPTGGVLVDGLLGTGASGAPRPPQAELIERANALGLPTVAADLPSGADPTSGEVPGACVRADLTVCFGWPKLGLLRYPARGFAGRIEAVEIGFPPSEAPAGARVITARWVRDMLRPRRHDGHKGTSGYVLLAAGSRGMAGAAVLAARAAYRTGAGIVRVLGDPDNREIVQRAVPGAIYVAWTNGGAAATATDDVAGVASLADHVTWAHALAIGPGLGRAAPRRALVDELLDVRGERPAVLDADGLNVYADDPAALAGRLTPADVITPHPGELERLLGRPPGDDPAADAREAVERFGCVVVLKGNPTVTASPGDTLRVAVTGGASLAVGGTGDVLTGAIAAALAAGYEATDAATIALLLTGLAAERTGFGDIGMVAEDIPEAIPAAREAVEALGPMPPGAVRFVLRPAPGPPEIVR